MMRIRSLVRGSLVPRVLGLLLLAHCSAPTQRSAEALPTDAVPTAAPTAASTIARPTPAATDAHSEPGASTGCGGAHGGAPLEVVLLRNATRQPNAAGLTITPQFSSPDPALAASLQSMHDDIHRFVEQQLSTPCGRRCGERRIECRPTRNDDVVVSVLCENFAEPASPSTPSKKSFLWRRTPRGIEPLNLDTLAAAGSGSLVARILGEQPKPVSASAPSTSTDGVPAGRYIILHRNTVEAGAVVKGDSFERRITPIAKLAAYLKDGARLAWCDRPTPGATLGALAFATQLGDASGKQLDDGPSAHVDASRRTLVVAAHHPSQRAAAEGINKQLRSFHDEARTSVDQYALERCELSASVNSFFGVRCYATGERSHPHGAVPSDTSRSLQVSLKSGRAITLGDVFGGSAKARNAAARCLASARGQASRMGGGVDLSQPQPDTQFEVGPQGVTITVQYWYPSGRETVSAPHSCFVPYRKIGTTFRKIVDALQSSPN